jgi:predicted dehydrogenase
MNTTSFPNRRSFLKSTAAATLGTALTASVALGAASPGRRIGFVDLNLDNYHANVFLQALRGPLAARGFTIAGATGTKTAESRAWADKHQIPFFEDDAKLNDAVDFFMILAPSNPEVHLDLCRRILPFGKPTYVDKTFAPNHAVAQEIFSLADRHRTPMQTSSALRYTNVQDEVRKAAATVEHMVTWGGGSSFDEYAIHPLELLISVMGPNATALMRRGSGQRAQLLIDFADGRTGVANVFAGTSTPFAASFTTEKTSRYIEVDVPKIFANNQAALLDFFSAGQPNVDRRESLTIMRLLDAARDPRSRKEFLALA